MKPATSSRGPDRRRASSAASLALSASRSAASAMPSEVQADGAENRPARCLGRVMVGEDLGEIALVGQVLDVQPQLDMVVDLVPGISVDADVAGHVAGDRAG